MTLALCSFLGLLRGYEAASGVFMKIVYSMIDGESLALLIKFDLWRRNESDRLLLLECGKIN